MARRGLETTSVMDSFLGGLVGALKDPGSDTFQLRQDLDASAILAFIQTLAQGLKASANVLAHLSPARTLHPIPTPGKSHCLTLVCDHTWAEWDQATPEKTPAAEGPATLVSHGKYARLKVILEEKFPFQSKLVHTVKYLVNIPLPLLSKLCTQRNQPVKQTNKQSKTKHKKGKGVFL